ncbi:MAG: ATP-binding protein [Desulfobulbaceae bacterium]|nr:ATP-binding protein [Desulfobulbaceae bacterium]
MHGLKIHISLTFALLLASGMLLTNGIITVLWQHSLVNGVIENNTAFLEAVAKNSDGKTGGILRFFAPMREQTPGLCAAVLLDGVWQTTPDSSCSPPAKLRMVAEQAKTEGRTATSTTGNALGFLFLQQEYIYMAVPFPAVPGSSGAISLSYPLRPIWQVLRQDQKIILVYILINTLVLSVIGFFRLASIILRPIDRLVQGTSSYRGENHPALVAEGEGSEFRRLSSAINGMVRRIDEDKINLQETIHSLKQANETIQATQQEMIRAEKLASVGRLSAGLAHEIGNPLGIVLGYLGLLKEDAISPEEKADYIQRSEQELNRINMLVRQLLDFSRPLPATNEPVHIHSLLLDIQHMLQAQKKNKEIAFETAITAEHDIVQGGAETLRQAFLNFFLNAIDAIHETNHPEQGKISIASRNTRDNSGRTMLQVIISDNGSGISPDHLKNIFDPFFTTKDPGKGTGLGLAVSHTIIENCGGVVHARSDGNKGTSIIVELPIMDK